MRSLNEGIALVARSFASDPTEEPLWDFACECGRADCREWVELELPRYEEIRHGPGSVLAEGHTTFLPIGRRRSAPGSVGACAGTSSPSRASSA